MICWSKESGNVMCDITFFIVLHCIWKKSCLSQSKSMALILPDRFLLSMPSSYSTAFCQFSLIYRCELQCVILKCVCACVDSLQVGTSSVLPLAQTVAYECYIWWNLHIDSTDSLSPKIIWEEKSIAGVGDVLTVGDTKPEFGRQLFVVVFDWWNQILIEI